MEPKELLEAAKRARSNAYTPYSNFRVGAALLTTDGRVFLGANIENSSYGATICAERSAFAGAVSSGARSFEAIAIVGAPGGQEPDAPCPPCGICRQFLNEFSDGRMSVYVARSVTDYEKNDLSSLLLHGFGPRNLDL